jgi:hypothetical protein
MFHTGFPCDRRNFESVMVMAFAAVGRSSIGGSAGRHSELAARRGELGLWRFGSNKAFTDAWLSGDAQDTEVHERMRDLAAQGRDRAIQPSLGGPQLVRGRSLTVPPTGRVGSVCVEVMPYFRDRAYQRRGRGVPRGRGLHGP